MPKGVEVVIEHGLATVDFLDKKLRGPGLAAMLDEVGPALVTTDTSGPRKRYIVPINAAQAAGLYDGDALDQADDLTETDEADLERWLTAEREYTDQVAEAEHTGAVDAEAQLTGVVEPEVVEVPKLDADDFKVPAKRAPARARSTASKKTTAAVKATEPTDEKWG